jgi:hypothetical protein
VNLPPPLERLYIPLTHTHLQARPHHPDSTTSRQLSEVKPVRAWLVRRWVTTSELRVLSFFAFFSFLMHF